MEESEGEMAFHRVYEKLHHPTPAMSESLGAANISSDTYLGVTKPFALGAAVDAHLKLCILEGLFVPFEVLLASKKGFTVNQYLRNACLSPENDLKLQASFPALSIERWTDAFLIYMHFYCLRFPEQREAMHKYMHIIRSMEQSAPPLVWMMYDREFHVLRQSNPSLPWHALHPQLYFFHTAWIFTFSVHPKSPQQSVNTFLARPLGYEQPLHSGEVSLLSWTPEAQKVFRKDYCTHFNLYRACKRLPECMHLIHRCSACKRDHAALQCPATPVPKNSGPALKIEPSSIKSSA